MEIYQPSDDSYLFADFLKKYLKSHKPKSYLDMGTGSGILAKTASKSLPPKNITATDTNPEAVKALQKEKFKTKQKKFGKKKSKSIRKIISVIRILEIITRIKQIILKL